MEFGKSSNKDAAENNVDRTTREVRMPGACVKEAMEAAVADRLCCGSGRTERLKGVEDADSKDEDSWRLRAGGSRADMVVVKCQRSPQNC